MNGYGIGVGNRNSYLENEILQADPLKLVQLLYRGAIEAIRRAQSTLASGDASERSAQITKAMNIVTELMLSVNREQGGEVAANLVELYDYILHTLTTAHAERSAEHLEEAERLTQTLLEGWEQIASSDALPIPVVPAEAPASYSPLSVAF